jgi:hypothetical protein
MAERCDGCGQLNDDVVDRPRLDVCRLFERVAEFTSPRRLI